MARTSGRLLPVLGFSVSLLVFGGAAIAQGTCDGTWKGDAGGYTVKVQVAGAKGKLYLLCAAQGEDWNFDIAVGPDCGLSGWISSSAPVFERTQVNGRLPSFVIPSSKICRGGTGTLSK
jgi:hypothetical protein